MIFSVVLKAMKLRRKVEDTHFDLEIVINVYNGICL